MFDNLNEKRIYLDACFCGVVAFLLEAVFNFAMWLNFTHHNYTPNAFIWFYFLSCILLLIYSSLKGLIPGLVAILEYSVLNFIFVFILFISNSPFDASINVAFSSGFGISNLSPYAAVIGSGLITTLTRKRKLAAVAGVFLLIGAFIFIVNCINN